MIRSFLPFEGKRRAALRVVVSMLLGASPACGAFAQQQTTKPASKPAATPATSSKTPAKTDAKSAASKGAAPKKNEKNGKKVASLGNGKPVLLEAYHDWSAYMAQGKEKTCYALASPKERAPSTLKRDQAYVFISNRPSENVRNEVSIIMGFAMKDNSEAKAEIGNASYDLIAKGTNAWVKNPAQETQFIDAMKKGAKLTIKTASSKGSQTTDSYSLAGISQALDRVQKECQ
jgi:invasion protein IalB